MTGLQTRGSDHHNVHDKWTLRCTDR